MFLLQDFPDEQLLARVRHRFTNLDPAAVSCFLRLLVLGSELLSRLDNYLDGFGLTHGRFLTLVLLLRRESGEAPPSVLAAEQGVTRATMTGLLQQLEKDGLATRRPAYDDGRKMLAGLTPEGFALIKKLLPGYYTLVNELMAPLESDEKETLQMLLDKLLPAK